MQFLLGYINIILWMFYYWGEKKSLKNCLLFLTFDGNNNKHYIYFTVQMRRYDLLKRMSGLHRLSCREDLSDCEFCLTYEKNIQEFTHF